MKVFCPPVLQTGHMVRLMNEMAGVGLYRVSEREREKEKKISQQMRRSESKLNRGSAPSNCPKTNLFPSRNSQLSSDVDLLSLRTDRMCQKASGKANWKCKLPNCFIRFLVFCTYCPIS